MPFSKMEPSAFFASASDSAVKSAVAVWARARDLSKAVEISDFAAADFPLMRSWTWLGLK